MNIANPVSVWEFILNIYEMEDSGYDNISFKLVLEKGLDLFTYSHIKAKKKLSQEQAEQLSKVFGRSAESWLNMDTLYRENMIGGEVNVEDLEIGRFYEFNDGDGWREAKIEWVGKSWIVVITLESCEEYLIDRDYSYFFRISKRYFEGDNND